MEAHGDARRRGPNVNPVTLAGAITAVVVLAAWYLDQGVLRCGTPFRAAFALMTLAIGTWVGSLVLLANALEVPGAYGPVQYWVGDARAERFMTGPRDASFFLMYSGIPLAACNIVATLVSMFRPPPEARVRRLAVPVLGLASFAAAWYLYVAFHFYPDA